MRPEIHMTRVQRAYQQLPLEEIAKPLIEPAHVENFGAKLQGVEAHTQWVNTMYSADICAFSYGSSEGHGRSAWGFVL